MYITKADGKLLVELDSRSYRYLNNDDDNNNRTENEGDT
jgi:hypothetical protein